MSETDELKVNPTVVEIGEYIASEIELNTTAMLFSIKKYEAGMAAGDQVEDCVTWARDAMSAQAVRDTLIQIWEYATQEKFKDYLTEEAASVGVPAEDFGRVGEQAAAVSARG